MLENTTIPSDVMHGVVFLAGHPEIKMNKFLAGNKASHQLIEDKVRRTVILEVDRALSNAFKDRVHEKYGGRERRRGFSSITLGSAGGLLHH